MTTRRYRYHLRHPRQQIPLTLQQNRRTLSLPQRRQKVSHLRVIHLQPTKQRPQMSLHDQRLQRPRRLCLQNRHQKSHHQLIPNHINITKRSIIIQNHIRRNSRTCYGISFFTKALTSLTKNTYTNYLQRGDNARTER